MKQILNVGILLLALTSCNKQEKLQYLKVKSPNNSIEVTFDNSDSTLSYSVKYEENELIAKSAMGFIFKDMELLEGDLSILNYNLSSIDQTWEQPGPKAETTRVISKRLKVTGKQIVLDK